MLWRLSLTACDRALAYRRQLQADFVRFGQEEAARYWQAEIDELEARRAELLAWRDGQLARCSMLNGSRMVLPAVPESTAVVLAKYSQVYGVPMTVLVGGLLDVYATEGNVYRVALRLAAERRDRKAELSRQRMERYRSRQKTKLSLVG